MLAALKSWAIVGREAVRRADRPSRVELGVTALILLALLIWVADGPDNGIGYFQSRETDLTWPLLLGGLANYLTFLALVFVAGSKLSRQGELAGGLTLFLILVLASIALNTLWQIGLIAVRDRHLAAVPIHHLAGNNIYGAITTIILSVSYRAGRDWILRVRGRPPAVSGHVLLGEGRGQQRFDPADICFIKSAGNYLEVTTTRDTRMVYGKLSALPARLPEGQFIQVHRSYVVNLDRTDQIASGRALCGNQEIPVGARHADEAVAAWRARNASA